MELDDWEHDDWEQSETGFDDASDVVKPSQSLCISKLSTEASISQIALCMSNENRLVDPICGLFASRSSLLSQDPLMTPSARGPPMTEVTSQLYLGSYDDALQEEKLKANGITHIISLIGATNPIKGMKHMHYPMHDHGRTDLNQFFTKLRPFIEESQESGNKLFVHCMKGQNRSATVVIGIMMMCHHEKLNDARRILKRKRPVVQINEHYARQLSLMELDLFGQTSVPSNWMHITHVDMDTGNVHFNGDTMRSIEGMTPKGNLKKSSTIKKKSYSVARSNMNSLTVEYVL